MSKDAGREVLLGALVTIVGFAILFFSVPELLARFAAERIACGTAQQELGVVFRR